MSSLLESIARQLGGGTMSQISRQIGADVLLVADVAPDVVEIRDDSSLIGGKRDATGAHQDHQTDGFEDHRLAARVGTRNHQDVDHFRHPDIQRHHQVVRVTTIGLSENLEAQGVETFVEEWVPGG